jgi:uncharacterized membrane protein
MGTLIYDFLKNIGYHHPIHPPFTHVPVGLVIAGFIFILLAWVLKGSGFARTAKHTTVLAFISAIPTVFIGYVDWQVFYAGAFILPINMKMILAGLLLIVLGILVFISLRHEENLKRRLQLHFLSLLLVSGIGYFGGELVYGKKSAAPSAVTENLSVQAGAKLFGESCAFCHFTDKTDTKVGPGLKGLFQAEHLPTSKKSVSNESIEAQLKTPYKKMPAFESLTEDQVKSLIDYLKTL